jgi:hypothetical protein
VLWVLGLALGCSIADVGLVLACVRNHCKLMEQEMTALKELLVRRASTRVRLDFAKTVGYQLPTTYRSKLSNFLLWNRVSYRKPQQLPSGGRELRQARVNSGLMWGALALATADDDADSGRIDAQQFSERLHFIYNTVLLSFNSFHAGASLRCGSEFGSLPMSEQKAVSPWIDETSFRAFVFRYGPRPHTVELDVNCFGALMFGRSLAEFAKVLALNGSSVRRIELLICLVGRELLYGIEGQESSMSLIGDDFSSFQDFLEASHKLAAPIARILTFLRSPERIGDLKRHYRRFDPTIFQFVLDDMPDFFEDSAVGKIGILHALIFAQADLAKLIESALRREATTVELADSTRLNFLAYGNWSTTENYLPERRKKVNASLADLRRALENREGDTNVSLKKLSEVRMALGRELAYAMRKRDRAECASVLLRSGILRKVVACVREDQKQVPRLVGVTSMSVGLFPLVAKLMATKCAVLAWYHYLRWRMM